MRTYCLHLDRCNQRCIFCMKSEHIGIQKHVSYRRLCDEILLAQKRGYDNVDFYGGEPTTFAFLKRLIRFVNAQGMTATLATNGLRFASQRYTDDFFSGVSLAGIRTSLHSIYPEIHDLVTQVPGSYARTIRGIQNILRHNRCISVNTVVTQLNYRLLPRIPAHIYRMGVRGIKFSGLLSRGAAQDHAWLLVKDELVYEYLEKAYQNARKLGFLNIEGEKLKPDFFKRRELSFVRFMGEK